MKGWEVKQIGDVCTLKSGTTVNKSLEKASGDVPYLKVADMSLPENELEITTSSRFLNEDTLKKNSLFPVGTTIFPKRGGAILTNKKRLTAIPLCADLNIMGVIPSKALLPKFLYFYFLNVDMRELGSGSSIPQINNYDIAPLTIAFPALAEQKQIVAILDEAFEGIDSAIANTEKNLANACELFESYLNAIFTRKGDDWVEKKVCEIGGKVFTGPFGSLLHKADYIADGIPIVNPANIEDCEIVPNWNKTVSPEVIERLQSYVLSQNDIVIGRRGEIGRCAVVREEHAGWLCGSGSFFIQTFENVDSDFLVYLFSSAKYRSRLEAVSTGATMQNLSNQALSGLVIAMPPLTEQKRVTAKLEDLKVETQRLEAIYQQKLVALNELKQSILQKAFSGELTAEVGDAAVEQVKEVAVA